MSETNGKTPEQVKADKFATEPNKFFHEDDIVMAVLKSESGMMTCHGAVTRMELEQALARITYKTMMVFQHMDMKNALADQKKSDIVVVGEHNGAPLYRRK